MKFRNFFLCVVFCIISNSAFSQAYFESSKISPTLLDKPIDRKSAEYKQEILYIIKLQKSAQKSEIEAAVNEIKITPEMLIKNVYPQFSETSFPKTFKLLERTLKTSFDAAGDAKEYWKTKRPFLSDKRIKVLIPTSDTPAYPSGHATSSFVVAKVLGLLIPQKAEQFELYAKKTANHRVLVGMHFPHDLNGGRQLGFLIIGGLFQNKDFLSDFAAAKLEIEKSGLMQANSSSETTIY